MITAGTEEARGENKAGKALRVTHVVLSLDCGGLERIVLDLVREGLREGHQPSVICLERPGVLAPEVEALGVPVISLGKRPGLTPRIVSSIRNALQRLETEVVHTHQIGPLLYTAPAARWAGTPVVVHTEHGNHLARQSGSLNRLRGRGLLCLGGLMAHRFFCVSHEIYESILQVRAVPGRKLEVIANGIASDAFSSTGTSRAVREEMGIPRDACVIGTVGRLNEVKCQGLLIRAFARLASRRPDTHLLLVGDGPLRSELRDESERLGLAGRVHFSGYQPLPQDFLAAMDVFAITSRTEGMPLCVLEAWASGLPVIASRVGGLTKLIDDGRTGLLFDSGDELRLEICLKHLVDNEDVARALGSAGRNEVQSHYSLGRMSRCYIQRYEELLAARTSRKFRMRIPSFKMIGRVAT